MKLITEVALMGEVSFSRKCLASYIHVYMCKVRREKLLCAVKLHYAVLQNNAMFLLCQTG